MTEAELQEAIRGYCLRLDLFYFHVHDSRRSPRGFPDVWAMNRFTGQMIFAELKSASGDLTTEQRQVKYGLLAGGHEWHLWRPDDWWRRRIQKRLTELARVPGLDARRSA